MTPADAIDEVGLRDPRAVPATSQAFRKEAALLGVFYALMHGGILLIPNAVFWDDWVLYRTAPQAISEMFTDAGAMFNAATYLHVGLLGLGMWSYKLLTFLLWFASGLLLDRILARTRLLPDGARLAVVLLFLVLPFNSARVAAINFAYTLTCFFFFLAWYLMDRRRIAALVLFAASFFTPSLLVFYALPILDMAYRSGHLASVKAAAAWVVRRLDFLVLPFVFYAVRTWTFAPGGTYAGYNSHYSLAHVPPALKAQGQDLLNMPQLVDQPMLLALLALLPLVWILLGRNGRTVLANGRVGVGRLLVWLALGALAFVLGGFPYWILGLVPTFTEWTSRHQLLLPLGTALLLVAVLWALPGWLRAAGLSALVAASLSFGLSTYHAFWLDWAKQRALVELFARHPEIAKASFLVFQDGAGHLNAIDRGYRFYEWNGLLEDAFGTQTRFGINPAETSSYVSGAYDAYMKGQYKAANHRRDPQAGALVVEITPKPGTSSRIWPWTPLPQLELRTTRLAADAPLLTERK